ncbi:MAG: MotA/TolQ/ExbB proton channel family protein [Gammaproteobacteria bacterium]|nr:MotA/TolQ/ExbB proton channel family protein [Gammaproteobacteria bacterium]
MKKGEHHLLLVWLMLISLIGFALFLALKEKVLLLLYLGDSSKLSWVITLMFIIITIYCARRVWFISVEINNSEKVCALARRHELSVEEDQIYLDGSEKLPDCLLTRYLLDLFYRAQSVPAEDEQAENNTINANNKELIEVFEAKLKNPHNLGWFFTDIMIKLGLLGTIIGFVLMLGSVVNVTDFDVTTMQNILKEMSSGMGTALYTTFAGLTCSILTAAQFHLLDQAADELVDTTKHLTQVHILPRLT